ncbi:MAG TPA: DUF3106 domain-containing protein [Ramlibacter sp.]|jgi:hypothetical protein
MTRSSSPWAARAGLLLACACLSAAAVAADAPAGTDAAPSVPGQSTRRPPPVRMAQATKPESSPGWRELTPAQQQALAPLTGSWAKLSEAHKRKWLALSANYPTMAQPEQALLHSRMAEWAALSPQQRTQARLNFAESKTVPADDKKAKWEAYQALPAEEKRKLAAGARAAKPPAPPTAAAVQPEPEQKLAKPPTPPVVAKPNARTPRIAGTASADNHALPPPPATGGSAPVQR